MTPFRLSAAALLALVAVLVAPAPASTNAGGAPPGFAGDVSTSSGPQVCTACHGSFALNSGSGSLQIGAPTTVAPGETTRITVTLDNQTGEAGTRVQGFQATVRDLATGEAVGRITLVDAATQFAGFRAADTVYVTHRAANPSTTQWTFDWTAPAADVPAAVRVYAAGNAANGNGSPTGDRIYTATADVSLAGVAGERAPAAPTFALSAPSPSPARGGTVRVTLTLAEAGPVTVRLLDGSGRTVRVLADGLRPAGAYTLAVGAEGLAAGPYFVVADGPGGRRVRSLAVAR